MKNIDRKIRKLAKTEKYEENPYFSKQLIHMTEDLVKESRHTLQKTQRKFFCRKYIPAAICAVILAAYPVKAATDYVAEHLAKVSEEEKNELRTMVYENDKKHLSVEQEAICYSRDFTESEQKLYDTLIEQYEAGAFPQDTLTVSVDIHTADQNTVCYNPEENCIYLPDHELKEEELLEIIDFYHKLDYSLRTSDTTLEYKADLKNKQTVLPAHALSEEEAVTSAAYFAEKMFDISTKNMEHTLDTDAGNYSATFITDQTSYSVRIQADNGACKDISMDKEGFVYYQDYAQADKTRILLKGKEAKTIAIQLLPKDVIIKNAYAQYKLNLQGYIPHGSVVYLFDLESGDRLRISYSVAEDTLWGAAVETGGAGHKDQNVKDDEKRVFLNID